MLIGDDVLFIHVPKTAGTSVTAYLVANLPGHKVITAPEGSFQPFRDRDDVEQVDGARHENLEKAIETLERRGLRLADFRVVLAVIRNPYDLEVSRYHFFQTSDTIQGWTHDVALNEGFDEFCRRVSFPFGVPTTSIDDFYTVDAIMPDNMRLLRMERLADDLAEALHPVPVTEPLGHANPTEHDEWRRYITATSEPLIYEKYRWLFQFYPRQQELAAST